VHGTPKVCAWDAVSDSCYRSRRPCVSLPNVGCGVRLLLPQQASMCEPSKRVHAFCTCMYLCVCVCACVCVCVHVRLTQRASRRARTPPSGPWGSTTHPSPPHLPRSAPSTYTHPLRSIHTALYAWGITRALNCYMRHAKSVYILHCMHCTNGA
jgi:hypothetical protein